MSSEKPAATGTFKDWFDETRYREIADRLELADSNFDRDLFLKLTTEGLAERELMARLRQTSIAMKAALPGPFSHQVSVLRKIATTDSNSFIGVWYADFVGLYGLDACRTSLAALKFLTKFGSAEFAIREFILQDPEATLSELIEWTRDEDEHVRRLASEGTRPRLPWGKRLGFLVEDPRPALPILENLRADESLYVRKSVANHLNDISKDHPQLVVDVVKSWDQSNPHTAWITKRALRTLIKNAHRPTLEFLGLGRAPKLAQLEFAVTPNRIKLGDKITLSTTLNSASGKDQTLLVDYVIHYVKASGSTSPKVFKWKELLLPAKSETRLLKNQVIRNFSTRRHYAGIHKIEVQINGIKLAAASFELVI